MLGCAFGIRFPYRSGLVWKDTILVKLAPVCHVKKVSLEKDDQDEKGRDVDDRFIFGSGERM